MPTCRTAAVIVLLFALDYSSKFCKRLTSQTFVISVTWFLPTYSILWTLYT